MGRYGPMIQMGAAEDEKKPRFAIICRSARGIETITYEEAMDLFKMQAALGQYEGKDISSMWVALAVCKMG